jgi:hypothetical protein
MRLAVPSDYRGLIRDAAKAYRAYRQQFKALDAAVRANDKSRISQLHKTSQASIGPTEWTTWNVLAVIKAKKIPLTKSLLRSVPTLKGFVRIQRMAKRMGI